MEGAIGQVHGNYDCHDLLGSVSMVFTIYAAFWVSVTSLSQLRFAPNRPCMSLVIMPVHVAWLLTWGKWIVHNINLIALTVLHQCIWTWPVTWALAVSGTGRQRILSRQDAGGGASSKGGGRKHRSYRLRSLYDLWRKKDSILTTLYHTNHAYRSYNIQSNLT